MGEGLEISNTGIDSLKRPEVPFKVKLRFYPEANLAGASIIYIGSFI